MIYSRSDPSKELTSDIEISAGTCNCNRLGMMTRIVVARTVRQIEIGGCPQRSELNDTKKNDCRCRPMTSDNHPELSTTRKSDETCSCSASGPPALLKTLTRCHAASCKGATPHELRTVRLRINSVGLRKFHAPHYIALHCMGVCACVQDDALQVGRCRLVLFCSTLST